MQKITEKSYKFSFVGDIKIGSNEYDIISDKIMNGERIFTGTDDADLIFANLESPVTESDKIREKKLFNFKSPEGVADLFDNRFILSIANNHIMDYGESGLNDTIKALSEKNISFAGAGKNISEASRPVIKKIDNKLIGVICCGDSRYQSAGENKAGILPSRQSLIKDLLMDLKNKVDLIVVSVHEGIEYFPLPSVNQMSFAEMCVSEGASVVCYHHAHCISGYQREKNNIIFYGTGNYLFKSSTKYYKDFFKSCVWNVFMTSDLKLKNTEILPVILNENGFPVKADKKESKKILKKISRYSKIISAKKNIYFLQTFLMMINIVYLRLNVKNYLGLIKKRGFNYTLSLLISGIRMNFLREKRFK